MSITEHISEILNLQRSYSSANTTEMRERGILVRRTLPNELKNLKKPICDRAGIDQTDFLVQGKDGAGLKSEIPWVRFSSKLRSPKATSGWYVVLLFRRDGAGVYLALAHGSTNFAGGSFVSRSDAELFQLMSWARERVPREVLLRSDITSEVELAAEGELGASYEKSCVLARYYPIESIPSDSSIEDDILMMAGLLGQLFSEETLGKSPLSINPDITDAIQALSKIARPRTASGQGFALTSEERRSVELRAMEVATHLLISMGFTVKDVSINSSFDLLASRDGETIKVEVKGTTGLPSSILLTSNEVDLHRNESPKNALIVVHDIALKKTASGPMSSGGTVKSWIPWHIEEHRLKPTAYVYNLS
jgi:hypothetical protein